MTLTFLATALLLQWGTATGSEGTSSVAVDKHLKKSVPHTMDMISLNVQIYLNGDKEIQAGEEVTADTTGNKWKVVKMAEDPEKEGKIWLAEMAADKTCALVVRGTNDKKTLLTDDLNWKTAKIRDTDYEVMEGWQNHVLDILENDNNWTKISVWLKSCDKRGFKKIFSGHSLGGAVAAWLSIYFEEQPKAFRPDYVVTFGQPRLVMKFGRDKCPKSLQTREKAVRIVTIDGPLCDAATLVPFSSDKKESFCFESFSLDKAGNLLPEDDHWPNRSYKFMDTELAGGWLLHSSSNKYTKWLMGVRKKVEENKPCVEAGTRCDYFTDYWGVGSCSKNCCHGAEFRWGSLSHVCKAETQPCKEAGEWCDAPGWKTGDCGRCCNRDYRFVLVGHKCK